MGKQSGPTPEELEFIFRCFRRGLSDREVIDELGDTSFPRRNPRFMHERRRHFDAARKVLDSDIDIEQSETASSLPKQHFERLSAIASTIVSRGLEFIDPVDDDPASGMVFVGPVGIWAVADAGDLCAPLAENLIAARVQFSEYEVDECFIPHAEAEFEDIASVGFNQFLRSDPYWFVQHIKAMAQKKTFKGKCPICTDWA